MHVLCSWFAARILLDLKDSNPNTLQIIAIYSLCLQQIALNLDHVEELGLAVLRKDVLFTLAKIECLQMRLKLRSARAGILVSAAL